MYVRAQITPFGRSLNQERIGLRPSLESFALLYSASLRHKERRIGLRPSKEPFAHCTPLRSVSYALIR